MTYTREDMVQAIRNATYHDSDINAEAIADACYDAAKSWNLEDVETDLFWEIVKANVTR